MRVKGVGRVKPGRNDEKAGTTANQRKNVLTSDQRPRPERTARDRNQDHPTCAGTGARRRKEEGHAPAEARNGNGTRISHGRAAQGESGGTRTRVSGSETNPLRTTVTRHQDQEQNATTGTECGGQTEQSWQQEGRGSSTQGQAGKATPAGIRAPHEAQTDCAEEPKRRYYRTNPRTQKRLRMDHRQATLRPSTRGKENGSSRGQRRKQVAREEAVQHDERPQSWGTRQNALRDRDQHQDTTRRHQHGERKRGTNRDWRTSNATGADYTGARTLGTGGWRGGPGKIPETKTARSRRQARNRQKRNQH